MGTRNNYWKQVTLTCFCPLFDCWILMPCQIGQFCVHLSVNFDPRFNRKISISITPSSPEISTGCRKATHKAVQNLGRVITTALTYRFNDFQKPRKNMPPSLKIFSVQFVLHTWCTNWTANFWSNISPYRATAHDRLVVHMKFGTSKRRVWANVSMYWFYVLT